MMKSNHSVIENVSFPGVKTTELLASHNGVPIKARDCIGGACVRLCVSVYEAEVLQTPFAE